METVTFPLVDEPLALDLVNTRPNTPDGTVDLLATSRGLKAWLALQAHRLSAEPDQITPTGLGEILALREHITTVISEVRQGRRPPVAALQALTDADAVAPRRRELAWVDQTVTVTQRRHGRPGQRLLADLADAAIELLIDPKVRAIRQCDGAGCGLLFLPAHPRRRWCSPALCGNRTRVARYYERHKQT